MKKPTTVTEFKELVSNMEHRERFVFEVGGEAKESNSDITAMEIYSTCMYETSTFSNGLDRNIKVSFVDVCGKQIPGKKYCINKYVRLWSNKFFEHIFSHIA